MLLRDEAGVRSRGTLVGEAAGSRSEDCRSMVMVASVFGCLADVRGGELGGQSRRGGDYATEGGFPLER